MAISTLSAIQTKVRRLTRKVSVNQLSTADLNQYINTFVLYDFPQHIKLDKLRTTFTFYTEPNIDLYETSNDVTSPLFDFKNRIINIIPPFYVAGYQVYYSQSRQQFFNIFPRINSLVQVGTGDGLTTFFSGTLSQVPVLQNNVLFESADASNNALTIVDLPVDSQTGLLVAPGSAVPLGGINYLTGSFSLTFGNPPASGAKVNVQVVPYVASRPTAFLFYDNKITLRPVPDQVYQVQMDCFVPPTELLDSGQDPELNQWWQYIAFGAAKKVFEDNYDMESVQAIMPEFKKQEALVLRRTLINQANQRTSTIYTEQVGPWAYQNWWGNNTSGF
jgi:hypothetical protein